MNESGADTPQEPDQQPDWDREFNELMGQLQKSEDLDAEIQALLAHDDQGRPHTRALILTRIAEVDDLTSILAIHRIEVDCVPSQTGALAYMQIPASVEDDINSLLGPDRPMPPQCDEVARKMSRVLPFGVILIVSWLVAGDEENPGLHGQMTARRYVNGQPDEDLPAGLITNMFDDVVEDLLLGRKSIEQIKSRATSAGKSRWESFKHLSLLQMRKRKNSDPASGQDEEGEGSDGR